MIAYPLAGRIFFAALVAGIIPVISNAQDDVYSTAAIVSKADDIYHNPLSPTFGNPSGDVTIVEFYDYQCGYCKQSEEGIERILREDKNIKIIYKDFPKLGDLSVTAASATLASMRQGKYKYLSFHNILMNNENHISNEEMIYKIAGSIDIDVDLLKKDMNDDTIVNEIQHNIALGKSIGVTVTPSFIVGGHLYSGVAPYERLKQIVDYERSRASQ